MTESSNYFTSSELPREKQMKYENLLLKVKEHLMEERQRQTQKERKRRKRMRKK